MKTAMQELIERLEEKRDMWDKETKSHNKIKTTYQVAIIVAKNLIEKEKEQIMNAYEHGYEACDMDEAMEVNKKLTSGDLYYNMNYNQNK